VVDTRAGRRIRRRVCSALVVLIVLACLAAVAWRAVPGVSGLVVLALVGGLLALALVLAGAVWIAVDLWREP
jgi:hypothetical protein